MEIIYHLKHPHFVQAKNHVRNRVKIAGTIDNVSWVTPATVGIIVSTMIVLFPSFLFLNSKGTFLCCLSLNYYCYYFHEIQQKKLKKNKFKNKWIFKRKTITTALNLHRASWYAFMPHYRSLILIIIPCFCCCFQLLNSPHYYYYYYFGMDHVPKFQV